MRKRYQIVLHLTVVTLIILFMLAPVLATMAAGAFSNWQGCDLDEGSVHPCVVNGHDYGSLLDNLGVLGWLALMTIPLGGALLVGYVVVVLIVYGWLALSRARRLPTT